MTWLSVAFGLFLLYEIRLLLLRLVEHFCPIWESCDSSTCQNWGEAVELCLECGEVPGLKNGPYCVTCGRVNGGG